EQNDDQSDLISAFHGPCFDWLSILRNPYSANDRTSLTACSARARKTGAACGSPMSKSVSSELTSSLFALSANLRRTVAIQLFLCDLMVRMPRIRSTFRWRSTRDPGMMERLSALDSFKSNQLSSHVSKYSSSQFVKTRSQYDVGRPS